MICPKPSISSIHFSLHCPEGPHNDIQNKKVVQIYIALQLKQELLNFLPSKQLLWLLMWANWRKFLEECSRKEERAEERKKGGLRESGFWRTTTSSDLNLVLSLLAIVMVATNNIGLHCLSDYRTNIIYIELKLLFFHLYSPPQL